MSSLEAAPPLGPPAASACPDCGTTVAADLLACPVCGRLVHAVELKRLAAEADRAAARGDHSAALSAWRGALERLPPGSRQEASVKARVAELVRRVDQGPGTAAPSAPRSGWVARAGPIGVAALLLWKLKAVVLFALTKGKLLLLGLTKTTTLFSMLLSFGVYWTVWGWKFAAGLLLAIYVHEIGHVAALRRLGIAASAPMFIPGLGALVRMNQYPASVREDARVGLAGPIWGLGASLAAAAVYLATGAPIWAAIARSSAWLNLFNLLPLGPLDGGRGFRALDRRQRWAAAAVLAAAWAITHEGLLALLFLVAAGRALAGPGSLEPDRRALVEYAFLVVTLAGTVALLGGHALP